MEQQNEQNQALVTSDPAPQAKPPKGMPRKKLFIILATVVVGLIALPIAISLIANEIDWRIRSANSNAATSAYGQQVTETPATASIPEKLDLGSTLSEQVTETPTIVPIPEKLDLGLTLSEFEQNLNTYGTRSDNIILNATDFTDRFYVVQSFGKDEVDNSYHRNFTIYMVKLSSIYSLMAVVDDDTHMVFSASMIGDASEPKPATYDFARAIMAALLGTDERADAIFQKLEMDENPLFPFRDETGQVTSTSLRNCHWTKAADVTFSVYLVPTDNDMFYYFTVSKELNPNLEAQGYTLNYKS